jgi:hypothetical protein
MDFSLHAYERATDDQLIFLDCDMIVKDYIGSIFADNADLFLTVKHGVVPINGGFFALIKSEKTFYFLKDWAKLTTDITNDPTLLEYAKRHSGGPGQHALLTMIDKTDISEGLCHAIYSNQSFSIRFLPCSLYNQTNLVPTSSASKVLHYKGSWHRIFLKGNGEAEKLRESPKHYWDMHNLWQNMLRAEQEELGCNLLPWKARYRQAKSRLSRLIQSKY